MPQDPQTDMAPVREVGLHEALHIAQQRQREGDFEAAEAIYLQVLVQRRDEPNALHFLGVLRHQQGRTGEALNLISQAIEQAPHDAGPWLNLGKVLLEAGKAEEAEQALQQARHCAPDAAPVHHALSLLYWQTHRVRECLAHGLRAQGLERNHFRTRILISRALFEMGEREQAIANLREWVAEAPDCAEAAHCLAAAGAAPVPARASDDYVREVFDRFADGFETHLESLAYRAPQHVAQALARALAQRRDGPAPAAAVLDAGCGTGLCGPLLRPLATRLEGVDLSPRMLERARQRGDYDALHEAEITAFLRQRRGAFDAIASADVLIYFGDLAPFMAAAAAALRPGGVLVSSVEALTVPGLDHALVMTGRYSHHADYLHRVLAAHGLAEVTLEPCALRLERNAPVAGWVFSAMRRN
jgi:predicted TPR repeat methyltransferase